ncbi:hypothetical protein [Echinicola vietnamensis]|uniref:Uncharacterized protein n=1 Tax=Echinicola vietnamensis (strain DSM 17526 / LMG 23754 / KMM 6221) TaxID=926556 RepID=L0FZ29_ECHVK|nr:hypothetical protein [Echinicola vietnamensis]AGA77996.1 hypothetical protein Echvi_1731 [Echinicola vietnamensis DSM 17526]
MYKSIIIILFVTLTTSVCLAQEVENSLSKNQQKWLDTQWPITDTLQFNLPNEGQLIFYYNDEELPTDSLQAALTPLIKRATRFPEFEKEAYRLANNFSATSLQNVKRKIDRKYGRHVESIELGIPVGLDFTRGNFTPEVGFRAHLGLPGYSIGAAITNTVYFPQKVEGEIDVMSNWFINGEFSWNKGSNIVNNEQTIQIGYLLNSHPSELFKGTTLRAIYRHRISNHLYIQAGVVATDGLNTYYPVVGVRFW